MHDVVLQRQAGQDISLWFWMCRNVNSIIWGCCTFFACRVLGVQIPAHRHHLDEEPVASLADHVDHLSVAHLHHILLVYLPWTHIRTVINGGNWTHIVGKFGTNILSLRFKNMRFTVIHSESHVLKITIGLKGMTSIIHVKLFTHDGNRTISDNKM